MESEELQNAAGLLQKNWEMVPPLELDWESLRIALKIQLQHLMMSDFERLVQTMYRLDVSEAKFQMALGLPKLEDRAIALAKVVLERELQRLATWKKYNT